MFCSLRGKIGHIKENEDVHTADFAPYKSKHNGGLALADLSLSTLYTASVADKHSYAELIMKVYLEENLETCYNKSENERFPLDFTRLI